MSSQSEIFISEHDVPNKVVANYFRLIATTPVGFRIATYLSLKVEVRLLVKFPQQPRIAFLLKAESKDYCVFELFQSVWPK